MRDLFLTNKQLFTFQDVNWWTAVQWITCKILWCFYQLFGLSFWRHTFTADETLVREGYTAKFLQICSDDEPNSSHLHLGDGLSVSKCIIFGLTILLIHFNKNTHKLFTAFCHSVWWKWSDVWPSVLTHTQILCSAFNLAKCTHTHREHTPGAVRSQCCGARGAVGASVPCSRYWRWRERWLFTPPTDHSCQTWDPNPQLSGYKSYSIH